MASNVLTNAMRIGHGLAGWINIGAHTSDHNAPSSILSMDANTGGCALREEV